jgi:putative nucleotidyltransferase with HDIG domain
VPDHELRLELPEALFEFVEAGPLRRAVDGLTAIGNVSLRVERSADQTAGSTRDAAGAALQTPIRHLGRVVGRVGCPDSNPPQSVADVAAHAAALFEHLVERENAVVDLARALVESYAEQNLLYGLLPALATKTDLRQIGRLLVTEASRALRCRRASLLAYDEKCDALELVAACGVPDGLVGRRVPVKGSIAGLAVAEQELLIVSDILDHPELAERSRGSYESRSFAVIRVPLRAQGQPVGVLAVTERQGGGEFTAHDRKLLEALSAVGASVMMNCRLHAAMERQIIGTIEALASAVDAKDPYTHNHSRRVAEMCLATARELHVESSITPREIELSGLLHDIGKIGIPDRILAKSERLTPEEFELMKSHAQIGAGIVARAAGLERVANAVLHHHERYNGLGYPAGLSGEEIPLGSRLIAVADAFDALTSQRPYRNSDTRASALDEIRRCAGTHFDPVVVSAFVRAINGDGGGAS